MDDQGYTEPEDEFATKLKALADEREILGESENQQAVRLFREHLISSTLSICNMAQHAVDERLRLKAATYVVERNLGRLGEAPPVSNKDPFEELLDEINRSRAEGES